MVILRQVNFYPRSPYGERLLSLAVFTRAIDFYPRSPYGERPNSLDDILAGVNISIHALLTESDASPKP